MKGVIMAGGEGTRLRPITCDKPKPMIDIMGKPVMEHIINLLKNAGITDIAVTLMYLPQMIMDYFGDGSNFGVNLYYYIEDTPLGTAGSVKNAQEFLDDDFIIVSGDCLTDININKAIDFHYEKQSIATLVLTKVETPLEYGVVVTNSSGKITRFLEKPSWSEVFSDTINTGIYILNPKVLDLMKEKTKYDFSNDIFPQLLMEKQDMFGYVANGYWCDIGDINAYKKCHFDILDKKANVSIYASQVQPGIYLGRNCNISNTATLIPPCYIGDRCEISDGAIINEYNIIGNDCNILDGSSLKHSIIHKNINVEKNTKISGSIIADGVNIGEHCKVLEGSVIGQNTLLENMCVIKNNIKVWPSKIINEGTTVSHNLVWGKNFSRNLFGENGITGTINLDITPEFAARIGASFGTLKKMQKLSVSCSSNPVIVMLKNSFISGLMSTGIEVFNFNNLSLPMARRAIDFYGLNGGIHIEMLNDNKIFIAFLGQNGRDILRADERKLETIFMREDFTRSNINAIIPINEISDFNIYYNQEILNEYNSIIKSDILSEKISFDEKLRLNDEKGRELSDDLLFVVICKILLESGIKTLVVPITSSTVIENLSKQYNARIIQSKTSKCDIMKMLLDNNLKEQFRIMYDANYALVKICKFLSDNNIKLYELISQLPDFYIVENEISCESSKKGLVIKTMSENKNIELKEGVKIKGDKGWVLIIPHQERPVCKVIAEGYTQEFANELCSFYSDKVKKTIQNDII